MFRQTSKKQLTTIALEIITNGMSYLKKKVLNSLLHK